MSKLTDLQQMTNVTVAGSDLLLIHDSDAGTGGTDKTVTVTNLAESTPFQISAKQTKTLEAAVSVAGVSKTTVQTALEALASPDSVPTANSLNTVTSGGVKTAIDNAVSNIYNPKGSVAFASLPTLGAAVLGNVYDINEAFTTTADFVEGAGKSYAAGTNVMVVDVGDGTTHDYKFDTMAGVITTATQSTLGVVKGGDGTAIGANGEVNIVNRLEEVAELPTAASTNLGKCYLLTGTQEGYQTGGTYQCRTVADSDPTEYEWKLISANPLSEGDAIDLTNDTVSVKFDDDTIKADETTGELKVDEKFKRVFLGTRSKWDALTLAEKIKYDEADFTDDLAGGDLVVSDNVTEGDLNPVTANAVAKAVNYSTDEVKTGAKWIDGKPIYRKVLTGKSYSFTGTSWNATDIDTTNVDTLVNFTAYTSGYVMSGFYTKIVSNKLQVYIISSVGIGVNGPIVLEYTKTTD